MLVDGSGQVRLLYKTENVLDGNERKGRGRTGDEGDCRVDGLLRLVGRGRRLIGDGRIFESVPEPRAILLPRFAFGWYVRNEAAGGAGVDLRTRPPAGDRRQIVRRRHADRVRAPVSRRAESAMLIPLEPEYVHSRHAALGQTNAKLRRHGSKILADHHCAMAMGFERDEIEKVVERIAKIGALQRVRAFRDDPEPHQAHDVIDADAARVAERRLQRGDEGLIAGAGKRLRGKGRQAPILALAVDLVRRRADAEI